jgi:hypothetical protein
MQSIWEKQRKALLWIVGVTTEGRIQVPCECRPKALLYTSLFERFKLNELLFYRSR